MSARALGPRLLAAVAAALDAEHPYSAMLVRPGLAASASAPEGVDACAQALPTVPAATGTGIADDDGPVVLVAHAYASPEEAEAGAERLERLASEGTSLAARRPSHGHNQPQASRRNPRCPRSAQQSLWPCTSSTTCEKTSFKSP